MKDFILYIVAIVLFVLVSIVGIPYTALYYLQHENEKKRSYFYMLAFGIDVYSNISMGELFELAFAKKRGITSFGRATSISACIGELIVTNNFKQQKQWFTLLLDFVFNEKNHCINAYYSEIR